MSQDLGWDHIFKNDYLLWQFGVSLWMSKPPLYWECYFCTENLNVLGVAPVPALSSSGTWGKPLNISRNRSEHHKGFYFLKNSTELLPRDWPYIDRPSLGDVRTFSSYVSPQRLHISMEGTLISTGDNTVLSFALFYVLISSSEMTLYMEKSPHCVMTLLLISVLIYFSLTSTLWNHPCPCSSWCFPGLQGVRIHFPDAFSERQCCTALLHAKQTIVSALRLSEVHTGTASVHKFQQMPEALWAPFLHTHDGNSTRILKICE